MGLPIASQYHVPTSHRRRPRRTAPRRPYRAVLAAVALAAVGVWVAHALDRPTRAEVPGRGGRPGTPAAAAGTGGGQLKVDGLEAGACWALPPAATARGRTVFLDPGHGGPDPGAQGQGVQEKDATLAVGLKLAALLRADSWRVVLSRTADTSVAKLGADEVADGALRGSALQRDLVARIACANAAHADVLVSIHFNGFDDPSVGGTETFYDPDRPFSERSLRLARSLQSALVAAVGSDDRGVTADTDLDASTVTETGSAYGHLVELGPAMPGWVDQPSAMPGALVEPLFLTDPEEASMAASAAGQQRIAGALFSGLRSYLG